MRQRVRPSYSSYLSHWPLVPPGALGRPWLWVLVGVVTWILDAVTPPTINLMPLGLVPVVLAAWSGSLPWALALAGVIPWGGMIDWYWYSAPWSVWIEVLDAIFDVLTAVWVAVLMTALQRHAVRLAIERAPYLPRRPH